MRGGRGYRIRGKTGGMLAGLIGAIGAKMKEAKEFRRIEV